MCTSNCLVKTKKDLKCDGTWVNEIHKMVHFIRPTGNGHMAVFCQKGVRITVVTTNCFLMSAVLSTRFSIRSYPNVLRTQEGRWFEQWKQAVTAYLVTITVATIFSASIKTAQEVPTSLPLNPPFEATHMSEECTTPTSFLHNASKRLLMAWLRDVMLKGQTVGATGSHWKMQRAEWMGMWEKLFENVTTTDLDWRGRIKSIRGDRKIQAWMIPYSKNVAWIALMRLTVTEESQ